MDFLANIGLGTVLTAIDTTGYLVGYIASLFVNIGGSLVNWSLTLNSQVLTSKTVEIGWIVSRDLANLGFVLAIILIAFATILRVQTYAMQQTLSKLIVAALLVNFSLVIAGVFIDSTGLLTNFFINKATSSDPSQIGAGLASAFQVQKLLWPTDTEDAIKKLVQGVASDYNSHIPFTASIIFVAIFTVIIAMSLISLAAMLYIRYLWLTILLILMPLAWLFWIWPDLQGKWKEWWERFMRWTLFAPAVTFFIYLALSIVTKENSSSIVAVGFQAPPGITLKDFGEVLGRMLSVLGLLYGGIYTANAMGIAGANVGFAVAKGVAAASLGATVVGAGLAGRGLMTTKFGSAAAQAGQKIGNLLQRVPFKGIRDAGLTLREASTSALRGGAPADVEALKKRHENAGYKNFDDMKYAIAGAGTEAEKAALMELAIDRGFANDFEKKSPEKMRGFMSAANSIGGKGFREAMRTRPDLARYLAKVDAGASQEEKKKAEEEAVRGAFAKVTDPSKVAPEAYESAAIVFAQSPDAVKRLLNKGSDKHLEAYKNGLIKAGAQISDTKDPSYIKDPKERAEKEATFKDQFRIFSQNTRFVPHMKTPEFQPYIKEAADLEKAYREALKEEGVRGAQGEAIAEEMTRETERKAKRPKIFDQYGNPI